MAWLGLAGIIRTVTASATTSGITYYDVDYGRGGVTTGATVTYNLGYTTTSNQYYAQAMQQGMYQAYEAMIHPYQQGYPGIDQELDIARALYEQQGAINQAAGINQAAFGQQARQNQAQNQAMNQAGLGQAGVGIEQAVRQELGNRAATRIEASTRAEALLVSSLNPEQAAEFREWRSFTLHSKDGKRTYRITYGIAGNVFEVERGQAIASYCIHPTGVPTEDVMLAQKLMLETDEESFLKIANKTFMPRPMPDRRVLAVA